MIKESENSNGARKIENKIVQTYAEDMAKVIENDTEGLVKKIIHGEEEHEEERKNLSPESEKNRLFMLIGILLITLALATLAFFIFNKSADDINTVPIEKQFVPIIFNDQSAYLEISGLKKDEIAQTVSNAVNTTSVKAGGVEGIYLTENKKIIGLRRFITLIKGSFVPSDNVLFVNDNFLLGAVHGQAGPASAEASAGKDFFMLLKVRSTADIFESLRIWEGKMFYDLHGFLGINLSNDTNYLLTKNFEDSIVENKNTRVLYDKDGKIILIYVFADDNSIIITNSQNATHEIIIRLASGQTKQ